MTGSVVDLHATVSVPLRLPGQPDFAIDFVVDTGFSGFLTLPPIAIETLRLPFVENTLASLADDSAVEVSVYAAPIVWNGKAEVVRVLAMGHHPRLGTALLRGQEFVAQFVARGLVTIDDV